MLSEVFALGVRLLDHASTTLIFLAPPCGELTCVNLTSLELVSSKVTGTCRCPGYVGQMWSHFSLFIADTVLATLMSCHIDHCSSLLNEFAKKDLANLQYIQHCVACEGLETLVCHHHSLLLKYIVTLT